MFSGLNSGFGFNEETANSVLEMLANKGIPSGSLGRLHSLGAWIAGVRSRILCSDSKQDQVLVFCGDHGVEEEGVSAFPGSGTWANTIAMLEGRAAISIFCEQVGASLTVVDVGIDKDIVFPSPRPGISFLNRKVCFGTRNILFHDALTEYEFEEAFCAGREVVRSLEKETRFIVLGEMGIANTTSAASILSLCLGLDAQDVTGTGSGVDPEGYTKKVSVVRRAVARAKKENPYIAGLEVMRVLGGAELVAIAGAIFEAGEKRIPVLIDGYLVAAAAVPLVHQFPKLKRLITMSHKFRQNGFDAVKETLGSRPLLDLDMCLGEATGAVLALPLLRCAEAHVTKLNTMEELLAPVKASEASK